MPLTASLRPYASDPRHRVRQVVGDLLVVAVLVLAGWIAVQVHDAVEALAAPGDQLAAAGAGLGENLIEAGDVAGDLPLVGDQLASAIAQAGEAAAVVEDAGRRQADAARSAADWIGWAVFLLPSLALLAAWLPRRLSYALLAARTRRLADSSEGADLIALRALTHQPLQRLQSVSRAPAQEWRRGDAGTIALLARLELDDLGLR